MIRAKRESRRHHIEIFGGAKNFNNVKKRGGKTITSVASYCFSPRSTKKRSFFVGSRIYILRIRRTKTSHGDIFAFGKNIDQ